jgi:hypothetical protein
MPTNHPVGGDILLTVKETAVYLTRGGLPTSVGTLNSMRSRGDGPAFLKIGKIVYYRELTLEAYLLFKTTDEAANTSAMRAAREGRVTMTPEEMRGSLHSMFSFLRENGTDEFQQFIDTLEPEKQTTITQLFEAFVHFSVKTMTPDERTAFEKELLIRLGGKVQ